MEIRNPENPSQKKALESTNIAEISSNWLSFVVIGHVLKL